jgi:NAD(P)-dependent dehydrogenase (short-subunit alcohol dehydrogenase family)
MSDYKRIILVTGSNQGVGYELVKQLAEKGQIVYLSARNEQAGKEAT